MEREFLTSELKELLEKRNKKGNSTAHWHNPLVDGGNIMGSELEIGRDVNEDVAAISVRRDKDLYGFISPKQFLDGLTSKQKDLKQTVEFLNAHAVPKSDPKFNSIRSAPISNITRIKLKQEQQKEQVNALQSGLMQAAGIAVEGAGLYYTTGAAATLLSATGWGLIAVGVILLIPEILAAYKPQKDKIPYFAGIYNKYPGSQAPITGFYVMFDVYVSPGDTGYVTARSRHKVNASPNNPKTIWGIKIPSPDKGPKEVDQSDKYTAKLLNLEEARINFPTNEKREFTDQQGRRIDPKNNSFVTFRPTAYFDMKNIDHYQRIIGGQLFIQKGDEIKMDASPTKLGGASITGHEWLISSGGKSITTYWPEKSQGTPPRMQGSGGEQGDEPQNLKLYDSSGDIFADPDSGKLTHKFEQVGVYDVSLRVWDENDNDKRHTRKKTVVVLPTWDQVEKYISNIKNISEDSDSQVSANDDSPTVTDFQSSPTPAKVGENVTFRVTAESGSNRRPGGPALPGAGEGESDKISRLGYRWGTGTLSEEVPEAFEQAESAVPLLHQSEKPHDVFNHAFGEPGTHRVWVKVLDRYTGSTTLATKTIEVKEQSDTDQATGTIDDWERGDLSPYELSDGFSIESDQKYVYKGSHAVEESVGGGSEANNWLVSMSGLPRYPGRGKKHEVYCYLSSTDDTSNNYGHLWCAQAAEKRPGGYLCRMNVGSNQLRLRDIGGEGKADQDSSVDYNPDSYHRLVIDMLDTATNEITATLYDLDGNELGSASITEGTYDGGGFGGVASDDSGSKFVMDTASIVDVQSGKQSNSAFYDDFEDGDYTSGEHAWKKLDRPDSGDFTAKVVELDQASPNGGAHVARVSETTGGGTAGDLVWKEPRSGWSGSWQVRGLFYTREVSIGARAQVHSIGVIGPEYMKNPSQANPEVNFKIGFPSSSKRLRIGGDLIEERKKTSVPNWQSNTWYYYELEHDSQGNYMGRLWPAEEDRPEEPQARSVGPALPNENRRGSVRINGGGGHQFELDHAFIEWQTAGTGGDDDEQNVPQGCSELETTETDAPFSDRGVLPTSARNDPKRASNAYEFVPGEDPEEMVVSLEVPEDADFDLFGKVDGTPTVTDYDARSVGPPGSTETMNDRTRLDPAQMDTFGILVRSNSGCGEYLLTVNSGSGGKLRTVEDGLTGVAGQYDTDNNGTISISELGDAAADYTDGDLTISELGRVSAEYVDE